MLPSTYIQGINVWISLSLFITLLVSLHRDSYRTINWDQQGRWRQWGVWVIRAKRLDEHFQPDSKLTPLRPGPGNPRYRCLSPASRQYKTSWQYEKTAPGNHPPHLYDLQVLFLAENGSRITWKTVVHLLDEENIKGKITVEELERMKREYAWTRQHIRQHEWKKKSNQIKLGF